jgi:hypothetical protein
MRLGLSYWTGSSGSRERRGGMRLLCFVLQFLLISTAAEAQNIDCAGKSTTTQRLPATRSITSAAYRLFPAASGIQGGLSSRLVQLTTRLTSSLLLIIRATPTTLANSVGLNGREAATDSGFVRVYSMRRRNRQAQSAPPADPGEPATSGCGAFAWSELIRILP